MLKLKCDVLSNLPFVQFKKCEKNPWRSVTFGKVAGFCGSLKGLAFIKPFEVPQKPATLLKVTLLHGCFSRFPNCTNGTKSRNASQMILTSNPSCMDETP